MYCIVIATGVRRGELLGLKWGDVDFENRTISVKRQVLRIDGEVVESPLKTKNSYRVISIGAEAVEVLKAQKMNAAEILTANKNGSAIESGESGESENESKVTANFKAVTNDDYVFLSPNGTAISPDSVLNMLHRVLKRAGLPKRRFHDLKANASRWLYTDFATIALQNGVDIKTVSGMQMQLRCVGHFSHAKPAWRCSPYSNRRLMLDTYTHVTTEAQVNAANVMGSVLGR